MLATLEYLAQYLHEATSVTRANEARRGDFADQVRQEHAEIVDAIIAQEQRIIGIMDEIKAVLAERV